MQHPFFYTMTRLKLRLALRADRQPGSLADDATNEVIDMAVTQSSVSPPAADMSASVGGAFIDALIAFFTSGPGAALIAALIKILVGG